MQRTSRLHTETGDEQLFYILHFTFNVTVPTDIERGRMLETEAEPEAKILASMLICRNTSAYIAS